MSGILALLHRGRLAAPATGAEASPNGSDRARPFPHPELLGRLTRVMAYRAPDGHATWHQGPVGLGQALFRTHTPGEQAAPGVVHDPAHGLSVVADARLDDRAELVRKLRAAGPEALRDGLADAEGELHPGASAPRLLLAAWRAWGTDAPSHLVGDFAFVLWDAKQRTLFAARDPFGVKPLFVAEPAGEAGGAPGWMAISNTLPALLEHPGVSAEPNERALADHLFWGWVDHERWTHFAHIRQVERGSWLRVTPEGVEERSYWQLPDPPELRARQKGEVVEEFTRLLHQAVADRLPEPDHAAVLQLSGGLDSGSIAAAALAVRGGPHRLPAVTFGYERLFADPEVPLSRVTAGALGLDHTVHLADDWTEPLPGMARALPPWTARGGAAATAGWPLGPGFDQADAYTPALAARGRVTLTGWDGDALLYGDARGHLAGLARQGQILRLGGDLATLAQEGILHRRPPRTGLRGALRGALRGTLGGRLQQMRQPRSGGGAEPDPMEGYPEGWFDPDFEARCKVRERWRASQAPRAWAHEDPSHPRRSARRALNGAVWSPLFQGQDAGVSGQLLEARHPLMDLRLVPFLLALPVIPWCVEKGILRAYLRPRLPPAIWRRKKQGLQGDPLILTMEAVAAEPDKQSSLAARLAFEPRDPLVARRLLVNRWREDFLQSLRDGNTGGMPPYWATRAHAMGRWLQAMETRDALTTRAERAEDADERGDDDDAGGPEALHPA